MSLPYFKSFGWDAEVVTVEDKYVHTIKDPLLLKSIPDKIKVHRLKAFSKNWTSRFGLGSLSLRSMWFYRKKVNELLAKQKFDLIYFSTTEFSICILGPYWKRKFNIPYVIDMQDPWHSDYYKDKPKLERPKKHWFSYRLNKYFEPIAMNKADGLISVSENYLNTLQKRYLILQTKPSAVITFGAFDFDFEIAKKYDHILDLAFKKVDGQLNLVYIGRGGYDMKPALDTLFTAFKNGLNSQPKLFKNVRMHFIGTSYASKNGTPTISPLASAYQLSPYITEYTDRIGFYESLKNLKNSDGLLIISSNQAAYTASKIYPYILAKKPLLSIVHRDSVVKKIIHECHAGHIIDIDTNEEIAYKSLYAYLKDVREKKTPNINLDLFEQYTAKNMTENQVKLFNEIISVDNLFNE